MAHKNLVSHFHKYASFLNKPISSIKFKKPTTKQIEVFEEVIFSKKFSSAPFLSKPNSNDDPSRTSESRTTKTEQLRSFSSILTPGDGPAIKAPDVHESREFTTLSALYSENGLEVQLDLGDWVRQNIKVRVEEPWLVVEGSMTSTAAKDGGLLVKNVLRRYELPQSLSQGSLSIRQKGQTLLINVVPRKPPVFRRKLI